MQRRTYLKTLAGVGVVGAVGVGALSGNAAAMNVNIGAGDVNVGTNDEGEVDAVTIDPKFRVEWRNFDQTVAKIFYLVEAALEDEDGRTPYEGGYLGDGFSPVFRATPWINASSPTGVSESAPGTTGHYELTVPLSQALSNDSRVSNADTSRPVPRPLDVFNKAGRPDYESVADGDYPAGSQASYLDGTSMGPASDAESMLVDGQGLPLVNNFPGANAGYYGAAGDVSQFRDTTEDEQKKETRVFLRYTFELQRPNGDPSTGAFSGFGIPAADFDSGNSRIVYPSGELGNYDFEGNGYTASGLSYATLQNFADQHVGITVATTDFTVKVGNETSEVGVTGTSGTGAEAPSP
ncbi:hypothetical protein KU306_06095 [Haloferax larsenii]|uniref:SipW-cognate class signal peptide n=1 Tax=Haloferax larsenii TaxID=302484 RepID=A0ABY5RGF4_HALLR|nr:hypothetical protein [Haloferax larsenii]UVE51446.1 hypothetical protein KU306_06095 [Haloferax larsenii]